MRRGSHRSAARLLALFAGALACTAEAPRDSRPTSADPPVAPVRVAVLGALGGNAVVKRADGSDWVPGAEKMELHPGDKLRTHRGAYATLVFDSGATLTIAEDSLIAMPTGTMAAVKLEKGNVDVDVARRGGADGGPDFVVETRYAKAKAVREIVFQ